jgi:hypothetical protein
VELVYMPDTDELEDSRVSATRIRASVPPGPPYLKVIDGTGTR